jgi:predicted N-acetyltransferase YhbS
LRAATGPAPPLTLVAERDGVPLGTASLTMEDLPERAELFPWLAGVWVQPECRGQGIARALVGRVEAAAAALGWARLHLYTGGAAGLYARLGWVATETLARPGGTVTLMAKRL